MSETAVIEPPLLRVTEAVKYFPAKRRSGSSGKREVKAVDGVSFELHRSETLGIVGESGCGKSTLARLLVRLETPQSGTAEFEGTDVFARRGRELRAYQRSVQMIFQDPFSSLNPNFTIGQSIIRAWEIHDTVRKRERRERCRQLLELVGLRADRIDWFPHQLSGGQRQRVAIARAIALNPQLLVCDEPVSALDVSIQAQVLELLQELQTRLGVAYVFISHDLGVVRDIAHRVAVMYLGRIVETGLVEDIYQRPAHPYTRALLSAVPAIDPGHRTLETRQLLAGDPPDPLDLPSGCRFRTRCPIAQPVCAEKDPLLEPLDGGAHRAACHFPQLEEPLADAFNNEALEQLQRGEQAN